MNGGDWGSGAALRSRRVREAALVLAMTSLLIVPCLWQPHIQAGDLSSHLYNAWLASEIPHGRIDGFEIVPVWTNVLTDWMLTAAIPIAGTRGAERIVAVPAVILFFWGSFFLLNAVMGRRPWSFCPVLALFTYGLVFHFGFFNFYVSTGLCLWILGLLLNPSRRRIAVVIPLVVLAWLAHALPVIWAAAVFAYVRAWAASWGVWRVAIPALAVAGIGAARALLDSLPHRWSWQQVFSLEGLASLTAVEQVWLFDVKYLLISAGLACALFILLADRLRRRDVVADPWFHVWVLHLLALMTLPAAVELPSYDHPLAYIPQRLSLFTGMVFCLAVCAVKPAREAVGLSGAVAAVFFGFLFLDHRAFNNMETEVARAAHSAPRGGRVVAVIRDQGVRLNAMAHVADRVCIGHCFSYGNYEAASRGFRVRRRDGNRVSVSSVAAAQAIERGDHLVTATEDPLYAVCACGSGDGALCLRTLHAGEPVCTVIRPISTRFSGGADDRGTGTRPSQDVDQVQ